MTSFKNFSVPYRHAEDVVEFAPAYDIVSLVTGKSVRAAQALLGHVERGAQAALQLAQDYGRQHVDAARFVERLTAVIEDGLGRLRG